MPTPKIEESDDELVRAAKVLHALKEELEIGNEKLGDEDTSGLMVSRYGFTWDQIQNEETMMRLTMAFIIGTNHGVPLGNLVHGTWLDGVMVGVEVERNRRKESDGD